MPVDRFFSDAEFSTNSEAILEEQEFHHLVNVLRCRVGESIELVNGRNQLASATIQKIEKRKAILKINAVEKKDPSPILILAQATPRFNRLEFILEKGTELGATEFWLFPGQLSEKVEFSANQVQRMHLIVISAMKQCGRLDLPKIVYKPPLLDWDGTLYPIIYGATSPSAPSLALSFPPLIVLVGPEKGLSNSEITHLEKLKAKGYRLNPNILRTDTAALAFLSIISLTKLN